MVASRKPKQLDLPFKSSHGGRRKGAGRPNLTGLRAHTRREALSLKHPVHVTLKLQSGLPSLRRKEQFRCLRQAVGAARKRGFAVVHFAILSNHVHFILEPRSHMLRAVFQSLGISYAKRLNRLTKRSGAVFLDRYHVHVLKTPTEVRRAVAYVLTNETKHSQGTSIKLDPFSSAWSFDGWKKLFKKQPDFELTGWTSTFIEAWHSEVLAKPRTWLLREGWVRGAPA